MLWEAADLLQPLLAGGTPLEGNITWMSASLVPQGTSAAWGVRSGRCLHAGPPCGITCSSSSSTAWSSGLAGCQPQGPAVSRICWRGTCHGTGGGSPARLCEIVRAQRPRAVAMARPRPPPAAGVTPALCRLCPIHVKPQCEACRLVRRVVARCCARGHKRHPMAVGGAAASSRVLQAWSAPLERPPEPPAKRPCVAPAPRLAGRRQRPDYR